MTLPNGRAGAAGAEQDREVVDAILDRIRWCVESTSLGFDRWGDPRARSPGLYVVAASGPVSAFSEQMGATRWPVEECASVFADGDILLETAREVGFTCDGAVVVSGDGTIQPEMVRFDQLVRGDDAAADDLPYAGWMGARHMSALETSTREEILAAVTLSEEDGRVTVFTDGTYEDFHRDELEAEWRSRDGPP